MSIYGRFFAYEGPSLETIVDIVPHELPPSIRKEYYDNNVVQICTHIDIMYILRITILCYFKLCNII